jgi:hypothetical protein
MTDSTNDTATETKPRAPRKVAGVDYIPADIYTYAMDNQPVVMGDLEDRFNLTSAQLKNILFDYCGTNGSLLPKFATRGSSSSGILKVSEIKIKAKDDAGNVILDPITGEPKIESLGMKLSIPGSVLVSVGAKVGSYFQISAGEDGSITLRPYTQEA